MIGNCEGCHENSERSICVLFWLEPSGRGQISRMRDLYFLCGDHHPPPRGSRRPWTEWSGVRDLDCVRERGRGSLRAPLCRFLAGAEIWIV